MEICGLGDVVGISGATIMKGGHLGRQTSSRTGVWADKAFNFKYETLQLREDCSYDTGTKTISIAIASFSWLAFRPYRCLLKSATGCDHVQVV